MRRSLAARGLSAFAFAALLGATSPAKASPFAILRAASKAGQVAKGAGAVGKAASGTAKIGAAGKALLAGGSVLAAERAGLVFAGLGDDAARAAAYVAREPDGLLRTVVRGGGQSTLSADDAARSIGSLAAERGRVGIDVYVDLSAARVPGSIPSPGPGQRLYVLDAEAKAHLVTSTKSESGAWEHVVDVGGTSLDIADFAAMELEDDGDDDAPPPWFFGLSGFAALAVGGAFVHRRRKRAREEAEALEQG
jgi:MYXO-CTERM domain-containing protein